MRFPGRFFNMNGTGAEETDSKKRNGSEVEGEGESVDLDFDMWYGQFEFVGSNVNDFKTMDFNSNGFKKSSMPLGIEFEENDEAFQVLQQQLGSLQDTANQNDERYTRAKSDNAALQARIIMLEEQIRETEFRCEEKIQDEQRRTKELVSRLEREKQLLLENVNIRLQGSETECANLKEETVRQRVQIEKLDNQRQNLQDQNQELSALLSSAKDEMKVMKDQQIRLKRDYEAQVQLSEDLSKEIERLRLEARTPALPTTSPEALRLEELHEEMTNLRTENSRLKDVNEELQASLVHAGLETGRILSIGENSLAAELDVMSQDEVHQALKEQQEVNRQLRTYIEGILLNIVENHPQLLEVKQRQM